MTDEGHPWDDAPKLDPVFLSLDMLDPTTKSGRKGLKAAMKGKKKGKRAAKAEKTVPPPPIAVPPKRPVEATGDEERRGVSDRARAAANLAVDLVPYDEIAVICGYPNAKAAEKAALSVMAILHPPDDYETLQIKARANAARRLRMSSQMADAEYLIDKATGDEIPNVDRLRWASQAGVDLMNWATIAGAKAPTKVELNPGDEKMQELLNIILERSGHEEILDADVIEMTYVPPPEIEAPVIDDEDDDAEPENA